MNPRLKELYYKEIQPALKSQFGFKNLYMGPKIEKIVLNMGLGLDGNDSKILKSCEEDLAKITYSIEKGSILKFVDMYKCRHTPLLPGCPEGSCVFLRFGPLSSICRNFDGIRARRQGGLGSRHWAGP